MMSELKGVHVLVMMLSFFGITIAVNVALSIYAISTFSGEDVALPYQRGLEYNKAIAARQRQLELGWKVSIGLKRKNKQDFELTIALTNAQGAPLSALNVEALLRRPTNAHLDRTIMLTAAGGGTYQATVAGLAEGAWDVEARVTSNGTQNFEASRRIIIR